MSYVPEPIYTPHDFSILDAGYVELGCILYDHRDRIHKTIHLPRVHVIAERRNVIRNLEIEIKLWSFLSFNAKFWQKLTCVIGR